MKAISTLKLMADIKTDVSLFEATKRVAQAAKEKRLVLFIGAGVSRNAGYPMWETLLKPWVEEMGGADAVAGQSLPQQAESYLHSKGGDRHHLLSLLRTEFAPRKEPSAAHKLLPRLLPSLIATTNYDDLLTATFPGATLAASPGNVAMLRHDELAILHLHGHIGHLGAPHDGLILTSDDYDQVATLKHAYFERLRPHWQNSLILFLGYGAGDLDIKAVAQTVKAIYGANYVARHLALDLNEKPSFSLQTWWKPFGADVVPANAVLGANPEEKFLAFLQACVDAIEGNPDSAQTCKSGIRTAPDASPACLALAKLLSQPEAWQALQKPGFITRMEQQVRDLRKQPGFALSNAQALYDLVTQQCTGDLPSAKALLRRMPAVVIGSAPSLHGALEHMAQLARNSLIAASNVLAERFIAESGAVLPSGLECEVAVPVQSEAIATLIAALWIYDDTQVELNIGLAANNGLPQALSALSIVNTPLEPGYPPAESAQDLIKMQIWKRVHSITNTRPSRAWKLQPLDDYTDQHIPALKSLIAQGAADGLPYDLVLTMPFDCEPTHLLANAQARREIHREFGIWTVIYGVDDQSAQELRDLVATIHTVFSGIFAHL